MDRLKTVLSFLVRPTVFLIVGLAAGYYFGFSSGYSGGDSIGLRVAQVMGRMSPEEVRAAQQARSQTFRDTIRARSGVGAITP